MTSVSSLSLNCAVNVVPGVHCMDSDQSMTPVESVGVEMSLHSRGDYLRAVRKNYNVLLLDSDVGRRGREGYLRAQRLKIVGSRGPTRRRTRHGQRLLWGGACAAAGAVMCGRARTARAINAAEDSRTRATLPSRSSLELLPERAASWLAGSLFLCWISFIFDMRGHPLST